METAPNESPEMKPETAAKSEKIDVKFPKPDLPPAEPERFLVLQELRLPVRGTLVVLPRGKILDSSIDAHLLATLRQAFGGRQPPLRKLLDNDYTAMAAMVY